jgi:pilin isopeptide linkage protein/LPXTG-motif cell wall-anchored protein
VPGSRTDVKYDATVYTVTVELKDNGDGTLKVTKKIDNGGELKFVNEQLNVETSVTIGGVKVLKGRTLKKDEFKFVLADADGKWVAAATNDAEGNFTFKPVSYKLFDLNGEKAKVYTYSVWEVKGSENGITYDQKVYTVRVTVTDNGDGTMTAKADKAKSDIRFVNTYTEKKSKTTSSKGSKTGDEAPLGVLFGGLGLGAAGLVVLLWNRKKKKDEE